MFFFIVVLRIMFLVKNELKLDPNVLISFKKIVFIVKPSSKALLIKICILESL